MARVKQLTVSLENQPGRLAALAKVLADAKVNIEALMASTAGARGSVQLVVDNVAKAKNGTVPKGARKSVLLLATSKPVGR